ncbi:MAG: TetR/AcrR family transcriptional regulator [Allosphingosinicella sp.]|uniref:TetR/AcrR family transcriptional regulator n=1 Tax=Allosphingosinicella sp. TaxID=2823234 RepID=UPI0039431979
MNHDLNSVKKARGYHHGDLRAAVIAAAEEVIGERGLDRFSLRETARRAGVSPAAPAYHFGDARGLLTALAADAFRRFGDALAAADRDGDRTARIRAQGMAYVGFALAHPAKFDLMWRYALIDREDADYGAAAARAFAVIDKAVRGEEAIARQGDIAVAPSIACWSMVHGFARLALDGAFGTNEGAAERAAEALLPAVLRHLDV